MHKRVVSESLAPEKDHIAIGHDLVALVSSAMYTEPLTVYREIVQNSTDAIDDAVGIGTLANHEGRIDVAIDPLHRTIIVRDNGAGVSNEHFVSRICSIGASRKRGTTARGFRGIGRLVGLGYCQELIFRSRSEANEKISEAVWDCRALRDALNSTTPKSLVDLIRSVVRVSSRQATSNEPSHFFEVEMRRVLRLANDNLLNPVLVRRYLESVAPAPFKEGFTFGSIVAEKLKGYSCGYTCVPIYINGEPAPVSRSYTDRLTVSSSKIAQLNAPSFFEVPAHDGGIAAVGWIAHHEYFGAFPRASGVGGIRARVGNLQIGDESCFDNIFPESRFNQWTVGEVHIVDARIIANARRDYFEPNIHFENLSNHLAGKARDIARRCRSLSTIRRRERSLDDLDKALSIYANLLKRNRVARILQPELTADVLEQLDKARKNASSDAMHRIAQLEQRVNKISSNSGSGDDRALQRQMGQADILRLIRENLPNGTALSVTLLTIIDEMQQGVV